MMKLRGYTLTEVVLVLILGTLVSSMGYMGMELIMKQYYTIQHLNERSMDDHLGLARFKKDCIASGKIRSGNNKLELRQKNRTLDYIFEDEFLVRFDRKNETMDTLLFDVKDYGVFFENQGQFVLGGPIDSLVIHWGMEEDEKETILTFDTFAKDKLDALGNTNR